MNLEFNIRPVPKGRPKFSGRGKFVKAYTPKKTKDFESKIKELAKDIIKKPYEGLLHLDINFYFTPAESKSQKKKNEMYGKYFDLKNHDIDNLCKSLMDGLNGVLYKDDYQVVSLKAIKLWGYNDKITMRVKNIK